MKASSDGETLIAVGIILIPDLWNSRAESMTSKIGFYPGNMQERLARGTKQTTGLTVRYKIIEISWLLIRENLVG